MNQIIKEDIKSIIRKAVLLVKGSNPSGLSELSDHSIHNASIFQDMDSVGIAVVIYALSKLMGRGISRADIDGLHSLLRRGLELLSSDKDAAYRATIRALLKRIALLDERLGQYIIEVVRQAEIKKGSKIYDHGISIAQTADILGISQWELMSYIGKTSITDRELRPGMIDIAERMRNARAIFRTKEHGV